MASFTVKGRGYRAILAVGVVALALVGGNTLMGERSTPKVTKHHVTYPNVDPTVANGCTAEAAAYAAALVALQNAEQDADDAHQAWMDCEMGGTRPTSQQPQISAEYSVLIRD